MTQRTPIPRDPAAAIEVFYDGACPVCRREIGVFRSMRSMRNTTFTDVSDPACQPDGVDRATALARFHVRRGDGEVVSGARAFVAVWRGSPWLAAPARVLARRPLIDVLEVAYRGFLKVRVLWRRPEPPHAA